MFRNLLIVQARQLKILQKLENDFSICGKKCGQISRKKFGQSVADYNAYQENIRKLSEIQQTIETVKESLSNLTSRSRPQSAKSTSSNSFVQIPHPGSAGDNYPSRNSKVSQEFPKSSGGRGQSSSESIREIITDDEPHNQAQIKPSQPVVNSNINDIETTFT